MSDEAREERRKYIRISQECIIRFEPFTAENLTHTDTAGAVQSVVKNVSAGGVLFTATQQYEVGALMKIEIDVPGWEKFKNEFYKSDAVTRSHPVVALATIVRVEVVKPGALFEIGACFVGVDEGHQWALLKYVDAKMGK